MIILMARQIVVLHEQLIQQTGGIQGIRDRGLLDAAVNVPFQSFGGRELYPSIEQKAARLGSGLVQNHAFLDGNKRIGAHAMLVFLAINDIHLSYEQEELVDLFLSLASGNKKYPDVLQWIILHRKL